MCHLHVSHARNSCARRTGARARYYDQPRVVGPLTHLRRANLPLPGFSRFSHRSGRRRRLPARPGNGPDVRPSAAAAAALGTAGEIVSVSISARSVSFFVRSAVRLFVVVPFSRDARVNGRDGGAHARLPPAPTDVGRRGRVPRAAGEKRTRDARTNDCAYERPSRGVREERPEFPRAQQLAHLPYKGTRRVPDSS